MAATLLPPVQISPHLCPLCGQHFKGIHGEGRSILRAAPHIVPSSHFSTFYFPSGCQRNTESCCCFFRPQEQFLTGLAPGSILCSDLGTTAPVPHSVRMHSPQCTCSSISPSLLLLLLSLSLSLLHTYTHSNFIEGEKPFGFLPSLI